MPRFEVFHGRTYQKVADLNLALDDLDYQEAAYGSLDGNAFVRVDSEKEALLNSMTGASHFLRLSPDEGYPAGAVVKDAHIDKGVCTISMVGFFEYLDMVPLIASHKATAIGEATMVEKDDPSWSKLFYAETNLGILREIFRNLAATMIAQGRDPFFVLQGIDEIMVGNSMNTTWEKNYRLNTLETPNMGSVYSDLTEDDEFLPVDITVSDGDTFYWVLSGKTGYNLTVIDEAVDDVSDVSIERGQRTNRTMALAGGSDPAGNNLISRLEFSSDAAYSAAFTDGAAKSAINITRANRATIAGANKRLDQINFSTWNSELRIFDAIRISGQTLPSLQAVITQKSISGQQVSYVATIVTDVDELIPGLKKPTSEARRLIYNPANSGDRRSRRQAMEKQNPTGWR